MFIFTIIVAALLVYTLVAYARRKIAKPNYSNQVVWITGASSGIGECLAYEFNKHGAYVILSARNATELQRVRSMCVDPQKAEVVPLDMTNFQQVRRKTQQIIQGLQSKGQKIDIVIENAGLSMRCDFVSYSFENHLSLFDINVHAPFNHLQAIVPHFIKHKAGKIVGVSSLNGKLSTAYRSSYGGSKHAVIGILDSLRSQLGPYGIKVCNLMPGNIKTNLAKNAYTSKPGSRFGKNDLNMNNGMDVESCAKEALRAIYNDEDQITVSKQWLTVLGVILRNSCPDLYFYLLAKDAKRIKHGDDNAVSDKKE